MGRLLTRLEKRILGAIREHHTDHSEMPTIRQIGKTVGLELQYVSTCMGTLSLRSFDFRTFIAFIYFVPMLSLSLSICFFPNQFS